MVDCTPRPKFSAALDSMFSSCPICAGGSTGTVLAGGIARRIGIADDATWTCPHPEVGRRCGTWVGSFLPSLALPHAGPPRALSGSFSRSSTLISPTRNWRAYYVLCHQPGATRNRQAAPLLPARLPPLPPRRHWSARFTHAQQGRGCRHLRLCRALPDTFVFPSLVCQVHEACRGLECRWQIKITSNPRFCPTSSSSIRARASQPLLCPHPRRRFDTATDD